MKIKKLICGTISATLCIAATGCGGQPKLAPPEYEHAKSVTFTAYMTPPQAGVGSEELRKNPDYMTAEQYKYITDCGFDSGIGTYENFAETPKALELSTAAGIKYLVRDSSIGAVVGYQGDFAADNGGEMPEELATDIKSRIDEYKKQASFGGVMAVDEPAAKTFKNVGFARNWFKANYADYDYYVNLLPYGAGIELLGGFGGEADDAYGGRAGYEKYVNDFIEAVNPDYLCYDYYALSYDSSGNPKLGIMFLANLEIYAAAAKTKGIDFQNFVLTMGHWNYRTPSNYDDLAWQVYNSMAYGCRGFKTFTYWTTMSTGQMITYGLVDHYGNRTQTWYSMQQLISEVRAMENVYNAFDWEQTVAYVADEDFFNPMYDALVTTPTVTAADTNPMDGIKALGGDNDYLVGRFKDSDGRGGYMISALSDSAFDRRTKVELTFDGADEVVVYLKGRKIQRKLGKKSEIEITLGSGEGAFVIPLYK